MRRCIAVLSSFSAAGLQDYDKVWGHQQIRIMRQVRVPSEETIPAPYPDTEL